MSGRLALITGASAGIGAAFARVYAAHGYDLALTARREERLRLLAEDIRLSHGVEVLIIPADLTRPESPLMVLDEIESHGRAVDALVNNAGYGIAQAYAETDWAQQRDFLQVMVTAPCEFAHRVLPGMIDRGFGRIVNVASVAGLVAGSARSGLYGAAKALIVRLSQTLHLEVATAGVHVCALCPGFTFTEFHDVNETRSQMDERTPPWIWMGADEVAAAGYEAAEANRPVCVPGAPNKAMAAAAHLLPDEWVMALMARRATGQPKS
jgi:uncharacterized protein